MMATDMRSIRERMALQGPPAGKPASIKRAAVALILRAAGQDDSEILLIHRAEHHADPWSGHMAFPGGRVDAGDAGPLDAARRETLEEVDVDLNRSGTLLGQLDEIGARARGVEIPLVITPFVFELQAPVDARPNHEVQTALWVRVSELLDPATTSTFAYRRDAQEILLPCFRLGERVVWGLTYQMLMRLFEVLAWEGTATA